PINEIAINASKECTLKNVNPQITKNTAPALTPNRPGEAIGLRVNTCMSNPDTEKAAPVRIAMIVLDARDSASSICISLLLLKWNNACTNCDSDTSVFPIIKLSMVTTIRHKLEKINLYRGLSNMK